MGATSFFDADDESRNANVDMAEKSLLERQIQLATMYITNATLEAAHLEEKAEALGADLRMIQ